MYLGMLYRCTQLLNQQNSSWDEEEIYALGTYHWLSLGLLPEFVLSIKQKPT